MKTLFVKTYGCQMNVYDSARMADLLAPLGYVPAEEPDNADMVILNTCHIREKAAEKVYSELGKLRKLKEARARAGQRMTIAVAGCVAQAEGEEITRRQSAVDIVVGPQSYHRLPEMIARVARAGGHALETDFPADDKFDALPAQTSVAGTSAFLTVQEGCDKFCTFCVVPYTRGSEFSRPVDQIVAEARRLVELGAREITLLGQNVNAYRGTGPDGSAWNLAKLLRILSGIEGLARLRYTTSHPRDMSDDLIAAHRDIECLMPYLHLPVQSGSDAMLEAMNRQHTGDDYRRIVERIRKARGDIALSSDFIVGFPGRKRQGFRGHDGAGARHRLRAGLLVQIQQAARNAGIRSPQADSGRREVGAAAGVAGAADGTAERIQPLAAPGARCPCCSKSRAARPGRPSVAARIFSRCTSRAPPI